MPLLHQDNNRRRGGPAENRRSLADILELSTTRLAEPVSAPARTRSFVQDCDEWRWEEPGSPEVAQTPRALVPPACFPPRNSASFGSYSERARPGNWDEGQGITDLVASLEALALPATSRANTSLQARLSYNGLEKMVEPPWPPEQSREAPSRADYSMLPRRASFSGVVEPHGVVSGDGESLCWSGALPPRLADPPGGWSPKVFVGGLPWDITENALLQALRPFAPVRVEWPGREAGAPLRGYAYVTFEAERRVRALLAASRRDRNDWYFRISCRKRTTKDAQVIPWAVGDSSWVAGDGGAARLEQSRTVFVGALHGMLSARALAAIMDDLFSGVVYAGIDTDKNKYPIGSGRVSFGNSRSYVRAIAAAYITIRTPKFSKKTGPHKQHPYTSMTHISAIASLNHVLGKVATRSTTPPCRWTRTWRTRCARCATCSRGPTSARSPFASATSAARVGRGSTRARSTARSCATPRAPRRAQKTSRLTTPARPRRPRRAPRARRAAPRPTSPRCPTTTDGDGNSRPSPPAHRPSRHIRPCTAASSILLTDDVSS